jgi:outer membrane murein-binding lipoprotein Lpp
VATRKTYERTPGETCDFDKKLKDLAEEKKKSEVEGDLDLGDEEEEGEDDDDEDSVGTVEALQSQVDDLQQEVNELRSDRDALEKEKKQLEEDNEDLELNLAAKEEEIETLEEAQTQWRMMNSELRVENEGHKLYIYRLGSRVGDLESDMVKKLLEIAALKDKMARAERRRALMFQGMEKKLLALDNSALLAGLFEVWMVDTATEKKKREMQELEERRRREVGELNDQLTQEKMRVLSLEATCKRLKGSLKAAAQRLLMKVFSTTQKPWVEGHILRTWCAAHPSIRLENELTRSVLDLEQTKVEFAAEQEKSGELATDLEEVANALKAKRAEYDKLSSDYNSLADQLAEMMGAAGKQAEEIKRAAEERARKAREALEMEIRAEMQKEIDILKDDFKDKKITLEDEISTLQATIESIKRGVGGMGSDSDDATRVVPKGQGVLCCGCLRQIVNRGVKQLPPINVQKAPPTPKEDKARKNFFEEELLGMPDPYDILHAEFWKYRRDPMVGLKYSSISTDPSSARSASTPLLPPMDTKTLKKRQIFQPAAFR